MGTRAVKDDDQVMAFYNEAILDDKASIVLEDAKTADYAKWDLCINVIKNYSTGTYSSMLRLRPALRQNYTTSSYQRGQTQSNYKTV